MKQMIITFAAMILTLCARGETETVDGITWSYTVSDNHATVGIGGYSGTRAIPVSTAGQVAVPTSLGGYPVTDIGEYAFYNCDNMTDVIISSSVTNINSSAFGACYKLTNVVISSSVSRIGNHAFCYCYKLQSMVIPEGVVQLGDYAFDSCYELTNISIPSSVTDIGNRVFDRCTKLASIDVAADNPNYASDNGVLFNKTKTELVCFPAGRNGTYEVPSGVTDVGYMAFRACALTSVSIPSSVTNIGDWAFNQCYNMTSIDVASDNLFFSSENGVLFNKDKTELVCCPTGKSGVYEIPSGVMQIDGDAFFCCNSLWGLTIPSSVIRIEGNAFWNCNVDAVEFEGLPPDGMSYAGIDQNINIRYDIKYQAAWLPVIEDCGFSNATAYTKTLPDGGPYIEVINEVEWTFIVTNGEAQVGDGTNAAITNTIAGAVTIPNILGGRPVSTILAGAFVGCTNMTSVTIPASVKVIGSSAFIRCSRLADVYFEGNMLTAIGWNVFHGCNWDLIMHVPADWQGRGRTLCGYSVWRAGSSDEEKSVNLTTTNVVVQYVLNSVQPEIAVPVSGDTGFVAVITEVTSSGAVSVPIEWKANYPQYEAKFGTDFGKSLMTKSGKRDCANNEMLVWQDYVAGTDPTNPDSKFSASITMVEGVPVISYSPELTAEQAALRTYKTWGKKQLADNEWADLTDASGETLKTYNFFKVTVEMK